MKRKEFINLAATVLQRLDAILPPLAQEPDWTAVAYRWHKLGNKGILESLPHPHTFSLDCLAAVDEQRRQLVRNTEQFLAGRPANNVLMTGARGTGKSSWLRRYCISMQIRGCVWLRLIKVIC